MPTNAVGTAKDALLQALEKDTHFATNPAKAKLLAFLDTFLPLSDFVTRVCVQHAGAMSQFYSDLYQSTQNASQQTVKGELFAQKPSYPLSQAALQGFDSALLECQHEPDFLRELRRFRQVQMACIATLDLLHLQSIEDSMQSVSSLADTIIIRAYNWIYAQHVNKYGGPEGQQDMQIMAMGKLGGRELNFSSDIDLIFAYPSSGETSGARKPYEHQKFFTTLAQKLIYALDHINEHGQCYRVDMRLRPMGDSGPLVMSYSALESYYQDLGRPWERFALQKMRILNVNKDSDALYALIKPFVYRKYVDFTTIDSIREMKRLIEKEVLRRQLVNNIKLGRGGIREVEFFIQALQLIHAGRQVKCQSVGTLSALEALHYFCFVSKGVREELSTHYLFLRQVEHYLQIFNDEQTQTLPSDPSKQARLITLLKVSEYSEVLSQIDNAMTAINKHFSNLIEDANKNANPMELENGGHDGPNRELSIYVDLWKLSLSEAEAIDLLKNQFNIQDSSALFTQVDDVKQKLQTIALGERGIHSINRLMPLILSELKRDNKPLNRNQLVGVFSILLTIAGRTTYIDLLFENPAVRKRLNALCRKSLWVAEEIAKHPILLDELLHPVYLKENTLSIADWKAQCTEELRQSMLRIPTDDEEAILETLRQFKNAYQLRIAAADISKNIAINQVSDKLTLLAEVLLAEVVEQAWRTVTKKHGIPEGKSAENKGLGIIAYGKFGGIELSYGSDLDIVCIYDADKQAQSSGGTGKALSHQEFYIKLVQKISHYCITKTYHGLLYEIDLRLRPSGNSGLLITHIDSFCEYQAQEAWTWEHQALVRARPVFGSSHIVERFLSLKRNVLTMQRQTAALKTDVQEMREKMRGHLDKSTQKDVDIKQCTGGIVDIEFMVQFWVLNHAHAYPELSRWSDNLRIIEACAKFCIVEQNQAQQMIKRYLWLRHLNHRLQLSGRSLASPSNDLSLVRESVSAQFNLVFENTVNTR